MVGVFYGDGVLVWFDANVVGDVLGCEVCVCGVEEVVVLGYWWFGCYFLIECFEGCCVWDLLFEFDFVYLLSMICGFVLGEN